MSESSMPAAIASASALMPGRRVSRCCGCRPAVPVRRQYVSFLFYKLMPEFRRLPLDQQHDVLNAACRL